MKRTRSLTIETWQVFVMRGPGASRRGRCETCGEVVAFVTADEAARLARVSPRAIYRSVEGGQLHFIETPGGALLICLNSLLK